MLKGAYSYPFLNDSLLLASLLKQVILYLYLSLCTNTSKLVSFYRLIAFLFLLRTVVSSINAKHCRQFVLVYHKMYVRDCISLF